MVNKANKTINIMCELYNKRILMCELIYNIYMWINTNNNNNNGFDNETSGITSEWITIIIVINMMLNISDVTH